MRSIVFEYALWALLVIGTAFLAATFIPHPLVQSRTISPVEVSSVQISHAEHMGHIATLESK